MKYISFFISLTLLLVFCVTPYTHAQDRQISLEGTSFSIGYLLESIESQTDTRIVNSDEQLNRHQVAGSSTSPEMARAATEQAFSFPGAEYLPRFAVKTNLLYGATTTPNLGVEFKLNNYLTLDISGGWNPFVYSDNKKFAHWSVQPALRYWIQAPFNKHFLGTSLLYSNFNVGGLDLPFNVIPALKHYRYRGDAYSVSAQYGYQWMLSPRWALEASGNVGYMYLDYQKFECGTCGQKIGAETKHYFGITNTSLSIIYIIK